MLMTHNMCAIHEPRVSFQDNVIDMPSAVRMITDMQLVERLGHRRMLPNGEVQPVSREEMEAIKRALATATTPDDAAQLPKRKTSTLFADSPPLDAADPAQPDCVPKHVSQVRSCHLCMHGPATHMHRCSVSRRTTAEFST